MRRAYLGPLALLLLLATGCSKPPAPAPKEPPDASPKVVTAKVTFQQTRQTPPNPDGFAFTDPQHGWIAEGAQLLATTDGGTTWTPLPPAPNEIRALAPSLGWIGTDHGLLTLGPDKQSWVPLVQGKVTSLEVSGQTVWAVIDGHLQRTADQGATWQPLESPCKQERFGSKFSLTSPTDAWILCAGQPGAGMQGKDLHRTTDGGQSWQLVAESGGFGRPPGPLPAGGYLADLFFLDDTYGWLSLSRGVIVATKDGGQSWHGLPGTQAEVVFPGAVQFFSHSEGFALLAANGQTVLHATTDAGRSWRPLYPTLRPLSWIPNQILGAQTWVSAGTVADQGAILWTHDAGAHWQQVGTLGKPIHYLTFLDERRGWAIDRDHQVHGTTDGGATWQPLATSPEAPEERFFRLRFFTPEQGYAISGWGHLYQTTDGGHSFQLVSNSNGSAETDFADPSTGWRISNFGLEASKDGGKSWAPSTLQTRALAIESVTSEITWMLGGALKDGRHEPALFRTSDGGANWVRYELPGVEVGVLQFSDPDHGLLFDPANRLFRTSDGGQSWSELP